MIKELRLYNKRISNRKDLMDVIEFSGENFKVAITKDGRLAFWDLDEGEPPWKIDEAPELEAEFIVTLKLFDTLKKFIAEKYPDAVNYFNSEIWEIQIIPSPSTERAKCLLRVLKFCLEGCGPRKLTSNFKNIRVRKNMICL